MDDRSGRVPVARLSTATVPRRLPEDAVGEDSTPCLAHGRSQGVARVQAKVDDEDSTLSLASSPAPHTSAKTHVTIFQALS